MHGALDGHTEGYIRSVIRWLKIITRRSENGVGVLVWLEVGRQPRGTDRFEKPVEILAVRTGFQIDLTGNHVHCPYRS